MEHKFGVFSTVAELNRAAQAQKDEGDEQALFDLAEENGIDREDAEDFLDGAADCLCTPYMAALAKLNLEEKDLDLKSQLKDWKDFVVNILTNYPTNDLAEAVFSPDNHLLDVLAKGLEKASDNKIKVDERIVKRAGIQGGSNRDLYIGMCGRDELEQIILDYYLGGAEHESI